MDHGVGGVGVVAQALLDEAGERRAHQGPVDAEFVYELEARSGLPERGGRLDRTPHDLAPAPPVGVADPEVLLLGAGGGDALEGGVRDVLADPAPDGDLRAAVDLHVPDHARVAVGEVPRERVGGLVHVVVRVEDREVELARRHRRAP
ncbi:MAG TPA: hypothetical protein VFZ77_23800 [Acidimicrobiales bacterium]